MIWMRKRNGAESPEQEYENQIVELAERLEIGRWNKQKGRPSFVKLHAEELLFICTVIHTAGAYRRQAELEAEAEGGGWPSKY